MTGLQKQADYDVAIVGGGINGAVAAARLSAAGYSVALFEQGDFACTTSQESSNLVWGGIKYLQSYEFELVYKLCRSRNQLLNAYPNRIREIGFLASIGPKAPFGPVMGLLGTMAYWAIGAFRTQRPKVFGKTKAGSLEPHFLPNRNALEYFDAQLPDNDSRFVWDFIKTARQLGAECLNYHKVVGADFDSVWQLRIENTVSRQSRNVSAKVLVNATGPFALGVSDLLQVKPKSNLVLSKGVHLVVPKIHSSDRVLAFWDEQGRMFYVLPMHDRSVIGTTDTRVSAETKEVTKEDREFLLRQINKEMRLDRPLTEADIIAERCGVRPLVADSKGKDVADWHKLSRKHVIEVDSSKQTIAIFGGKLTDCLNVGDEVLGEILNLGIVADKKTDSWFGEESGDMRDKFVSRAIKVLPANQEKHLIIESLWRRHGSQAHEILDLITDRLSLSESVFPGLGICAAEILYVLENEMILSEEDLIRRRLPIAMTRSESEISQNRVYQQLVKSKLKQQRRVA